MYNDAPAGDGHPGAMLGILARARQDGLKALAETLLDGMANVEAIHNRTRLVLVPMRDTVADVDFHLGEVLVSEAHITDPDGHVGYGMIAGRDLERAMAMAVIDLRSNIGEQSAVIERFLAEEGAHLAAEDALRMRQVEATRVEMEAF